MDPVRDLGIIQNELRIKDAEFVEKQLEALKKQTARGGQSLEMKKLKEELAIVQAVYDCLTVEKVDVRKKNWGNKEVSLMCFTLSQNLYDDKECLHSRFLTQLVEHLIIRMF